MILFKKQLTYTIGLLCIVLTFSTPCQVHAGNHPGLTETIQQIEKNLDARIGVAVYEEGTGRNWQYHADDRFPMSSTFKTLACSTLLSRVDAGQEKLDRSVVFEEKDLVTYSPVTKTRVGASGMSLSELCEATMSMSDNSAANFILRNIGGPEAVTTFVRSVGDTITRLDRWEPDLNEATPGDVRDTTTPNAMVQTLKSLVFGDTLNLRSREQLINWLKGNKVGDALFRAGVPSTWVVADKTGAGGHGSRSIAAIMWPPKSQPIIATVYITETEATFDARNAAIAEIGEVIAREVTSQ
ncbi:class A beta-lactamase [Desulforhopalus sp. IMCC35007]|uniref:class A beta-lactamase n=1 Tax=Desulforhopalus sp. IMCC35007 TaxID=2569543 RepID=UPI0010AE30B4|nr:class A beta-lactamase [Desulforhopalus sp. IMCC35007]TKB11154.1 class A beta-lactamase [Desulforhopalus sp. IMCC35007]